MRRIDHQVIEARGPQVEDVMFEQGATAHWQKGLRSMRRKGQHALTASRRKNHGLQESATCRYQGWVVQAGSTISRKTSSKRATAGDVGA